MLELLREVASHVIAEIITTLILVIVGLFSFRRIKSLYNATKFCRRMMRNGFTNFFNSRDEYAWGRKQRDLRKYILQTKKHFKYIGFYLYSGTEGALLDDAFATLLRSGCSIELVLLDEKIDNYFVTIMEEHIGLAPKTLVPRLSQARSHYEDFKNRLSTVERTKFDIRFHTTVLFSSVMFIDWDEKFGRMLIDTKIRGAGREKSFGMEFHKTLEDSLSSELAKSFGRIKYTT